MKKALCMLLALVLTFSLVSLSVAEEAAPKYHYTAAVTDDVNAETWNVVNVNKIYNVEFDIQHIERDVKEETLSLLAASDELPETFAFGSLTNLLNMFLDQGLIGTWSEEFFREHCPRISAALDKYSPDSWALAERNGEMFAIPGYDKTATNDPVAWNGTWLKNLGYDAVPETLEEWGELFYKMTYNDPDQNGIQDTYGLSDTGFIAVYGAYGFQRGYWIEDGNGGVVLGDVNPKAKEALAVLADWYAKGVICPEFITGERASGGYWALANEFVNQMIGVTLLAHDYHYQPAMPDKGFDIAYDNMGTNGKAVIDSGRPFDWEFSAPPVGPYGDRGVQKRDNTPNGNSFSAELVADTDRFAYLLEIIDEMNGTWEGYCNSRIGYEGEHWNVVDLGSGILGQETIETENFNSNIFLWTQIPIEDAPDYGGFQGAFDKIIAGTQDYAIKNEVKDALPSAADYKTECDKILNEGYISIITGEKPLDYFDEMVTAWYNAGGTKLTEEANEIYKNK